MNSGTRIKKENSQETNALETNLGAADELARQLRLRDMGGIIIVDFIDMKLPEDRQLLYERMCKNMQKDRARHNILPLSKFTWSIRSESASSSSTYILTWQPTSTRAFSA